MRQLVVLHVANEEWGKNWLDPKPNHEYNLYTAKAMHTSKTGNDYNF
jgi:hypothetical protein